MAAASTYPAGQSWRNFAEPAVFVAAKQRDRFADFEDCQNLQNHLAEMAAGVIRNLQSFAEVAAAQTDPAVAVAFVVSQNLRNCSLAVGAAGQKDPSVVVDAADTAEAVLQMHPILQNFGGPELDQKAQNHPANRLVSVGSALLLVEVPAPSVAVAHVAGFAVVAASAGHWDPLDTKPYRGTCV